MWFSRLLEWHIRSSLRVFLHCFGFKGYPLFKLRHVKNNTGFPPILLSSIILHLGKISEITLYVINTEPLCTKNNVHVSVILSETCIVIISETRLHYIVFFSSFISLYKCIGYKYLLRARCSALSFIVSYSFVYSYKFQIL